MSTKKRISLLCSEGLYVGKTIYPPQKLEEVFFRAWSWMGLLYVYYSKKACVCQCFFTASIDFFENIVIFFEKSVAKWKKV